MNEKDIETSIVGCEADLAAGRPIDVKKHRFWRAVAAVKADDSLVDRYADRIGVIDEAAFKSWALYTVPAPTGTTPVSYTHLTLPTTRQRCRSRWSPDD